MKLMPHQGRAVTDAVVVAWFPAPNHPPSERDTWTPVRASGGGSSCDLAWLFRAAAPDVRARDAWRARSRGTVESTDPFLRLQICAADRERCGVVESTS